jgi:peroxiredoxin
MKSIIKKLSVILFGLLIFINASGQEEVIIPRRDIPIDYGYTIKIGDKIQDFTMTLTNGKTVSSKEWKGKVVMLQFTASWSGVCRKAIPFIENEIWSRHKRNPKFELYGIDRDEPLETVKKFTKDVDLTYPLAIDPQAEIFGMFAGKKAGVTRNVIIDKEGRIAFVTRLFKEDEFKQMVEVIERLLKKGESDR